MVSKRLIVMTFMLASSMNVASAQSNLTNTGKSSNTRPRSQHDLDAEAVVVDQLVDVHLPELRPLLERLRHDQPRQYALAIRDLSRSARRLENIQKRDLELFRQEVAVLKARTQVKLLTAKLKVRDNDDDRQQLRAAVARQHHAQRERLRYEVQSLEQRIQRAQKQLASAKQRLDEKQPDNETQIEKVYAGLLRKAGRRLNESAPPNRTEPSEEQE